VRKSALGDRPAKHLAFALMLVFAPSPSGASSLIGTSTTVNSFYSGTQFHSHYANGYYWVAYHDGAQAILSNSLDGVSWTLRGPIFTSFSPAANGRWAVRFRGNDIIAFGYNAADTNRYYRHGFLNGDGTVSWDAPDVSVGISGSANERLNGLIANGKPVMWRADPTVAGRFLIGSQLSAPTWTDSVDAPPLAPVTSGGFASGAIFPTGGGDPNDLIVIRATSAATYTPGAHRVVAIKYDASTASFDPSWFNVSTLNGTLIEDATTEVYVGTDTAVQKRMAAVRDTSGRLHLVYVNGNDDVVHYRKDAGFNDSWSRLSSGINPPAETIVKVGLTAAANDNLFLSYSKSDARLYYRRFDGTSWGAETLLKSNTDDLNSSIGTMELAVGCSMAAAWNENLAGPFEVMFSLDGGNCNALNTTAGPGTITVTAPSSFEIRFNTSTGGGMDQFFDLAEDPARIHDLAGGVSLMLALFADDIQSGGIWYNTGQNDPGHKLDLLEVTPTRVRVRQEAFYQEEYGTNILPGIKGLGDYSVYPSGRLALRWNRKATSPVTYTNDHLSFVVHHQVAPPLNGWATYSESVGVGMPGPGSDAFLLTANDLAGARTDFLHVVSQDWAAADSTATYNSPVDELRAAFWSETSGAIILSGASEVWNFLTYFKPTDLINHTDPAAISRRDDYRSPDALSVLVGSPWIDPSENTGGGDNFNESEAAYVLTLDPALGLTFDIDGSLANPRYDPFFKIRQWRSFYPPPSVTLEGVPLASGVDYKADVKPVSRGHWASNLSWHCTVENATACDPPSLDVGAAGGQVGVAIVLGKYGNAAEFDSNTDAVVAGSAGSMDFNVGVGAVEFWYRPYYDSNEGVPPRRVLCMNEGLGPDYFILERTTANELKLTIQNTGGSSASTTINPSNFSWRANEWVHLRTTWNNSGPVADRLRIFINGVAPSQTVAGTYDAVGMNKGPTYFGGCAGFCPGAPNGHANGVIDEPHIYTSSPDVALIAYGGLTSNVNEYLADPVAFKNLALFSLGVDGSRRGQYFYVGSDSKFRGLNVSLATAGAGVAAGDLEWEYWNGTGWAFLEAGFGFTDETNSFTRQRGTVYWTGDPFGWSPYSVNGGPDLYYVRVHLITGATYTTVPVESLIKTDILLFQYCGDITSAAQTFTFAPPVPTAVELLSFEARGGDGAVELAWETAAEVENLGFYLYRGSAEEGAFDRITPTLIPGLGSSPLGARYRYLDSGLTNGQTYFYVLEDVETTGTRTKHGPVSATPQPGASLPAPPTPPGTGSNAGIVYGKPEEASLRVLSSDRTGMALELLTGGFYAEPQADGSVRLSVPGFVQEHGAIPVKRLWLQAVAGRKVRFASVEASEVVEFSSLRPSRVEIPEIIATRGVVRAGSRRSRPNSIHTSEWARLVSVGFQEERKKALIELAPLRWDGTNLSLARRLTVRVVFAGREPGEESLGGSRGRRQRDPSHPRSGNVLARLLVKERGLYRVSFEDLFGGRGRAIRASALGLSYQGDPVAYHLEGLARGGTQFGSGSTLYFVSEGASLNPYGDAAVYELTVGEGLKMPVVDRRPSGGPAAWYWHRVDREENRIYQPALLEAQEPWFWDTILSAMVKRYSFSVSGLTPAGSPARIEISLQGATDFAASPDHHARVYVNGSLVAEGSWDGKTPRNLEAELPAGVLLEGENELSVENVGDTEAVSSMVMLERFAVAYPRRAMAQEGFLAGLWTESGAATVEGLEHGAFVVDVTEAPPRWLTGVEAVANGVTFRAEAGRDYLVVGTEAVLVADVARPAPSGLKSERNRADYLVIGPAELLVEAALLMELRQSQGLKTKAVSIEEVYSEFGFGEERPEAVRDFLSHAYHRWRKPSPRYVLLLGDATYDFKNYLGTGVKNQVPPYLVKTSYWLTAADPTYASVNGEDALPDLAIGRFPARTPEEVRVLVEKIVAYETGRASLSGATVLVVDNPDAGGDFEADAQEIAASLLSGRAVQTIYVSELGRDRTRAAIREAFDRGASLMSYMGHGAILVWASENVFNNLDVASLAPQEHQPFLLTMNCLSGYFHFPYLNSLAEELLKAERKGVFAAFSPSGLSLNSPAHRYHKALLSEMLSGKRERLGDALLAAQATFAEGGEFLELISIYHLLGDPALRLR